MILPIKFATESICSYVLSLWTASACSDGPLAPFLVCSKQTDWHSLPDHIIGPDDVGVLHNIYRRSYVSLKQKWKSLHSITTRARVLSVCCYSSKIEYHYYESPNFDRMLKSPPIGLNLHNFFIRYKLACTIYDTSYSCSLPPLLSFASVAITIQMTDTPCLWSLPLFPPPYQHPQLYQHHNELRRIPALPPTQPLYGDN